MTETQLRFLRSIGERLPVARVVELYLFPPMRQGALETGIAIIAAERELPPLAIEPADVTPAEAMPEDAAPVGSSGEACDPTEDASRDVVEDATPDVDVAVVPADAPVDAPAESSPAAATPAARATPNRHTVFTARYRLTLKGPERGRWELSVVEEADAPLLTIEMVVRGVQRRTGDGAEPERMEPTALRELLAAPAA